MLPVHIVLPLVLLAPPLDAPPRVSYLTSASDPSAVSITCHGEAPYETLRCIITLVEVKVPSEESIQRTHREGPTPEDIAGVKERFCPNQAAERVRIGPVPDDVWAMMTAACKCSSDACIADALLKLDEDVESTCHIYTTLLAATFNRESPTRWVATTRDEQPCNVINVKTLELAPDAKPLLKWTLLDAYSGDASKEGCKWVPLMKSRAWSSEVSRERPFHCQRIRFGP